MRPYILPRPGDVLGGKYRIERALGEGGMGTVYQAVDQTLGRNVAIKVLDPKMSVDPQIAARFEREARVARHLEHPNTIHIFDYGQADNGIPYIVMEYLRGKTVDSIIKEEGAIPMGRTLALARQVLLSLAEAHAHGVIHRDLKPSNIIVGEVAGQRDFVKVLDFGIAKLLDAERESGALKTRSGMVIGSPAYMAPERIRSQDLTASSDLYSLGIMMLEMITGQTLFQGRTPVEILADRLSGSPLPIPDWVKVSPVGPVIDKATRWNPQERYQTALEMLTAIDRLLAGGGREATLRDSSAGQPWAGFGAVEETVKMDSRHMDLSKPRRPKPAPPPAAAGESRTTTIEGERPSIWSNPTNVVMALMIAVLLVVTAVIVLIAFT